MEIDERENESLSSDSSSDSEEENINEEELKREISALREQLEANYLDYDAHVKLISLLRKSGNLDDLRAARRCMNKVYPLSPDLWMEWLSDEENICTSHEERSNIVSLFEKAVSEYTSVKVWVEYIMFILGSGDYTECQSVSERALTAVGIHISEGALVWQAVLLVEQQIYSKLKEEGNKSKLEDQKKRLQRLYRRHSRVPLLNIDNDEFMNEASLWFDGQCDPQIKKDLDNTSKKLKEKLPFELNIIQAENETSKLEAYRKYLDHVLKNENPSVIQSIYERALTDLCLNAGIWEEYVRFALKQFPFADYAVLPVCERSQRNCPWSAELCSLHIFALQKFSESIPSEDLKMRIKKSLEMTLNSGTRDGNELIKSWMAYLVFLRRSIDWNEENSTNLSLFRESCEQAMQYIDTNCPELGDPECEIARFQARIEAQLARNMELARGLWNNYVMQRKDNFKNPNLWMEFIYLERSYGDEKHCRKLFRRALERVWDNVETIGKAFLKFEQDVGTLETMEDFEKRYRDRLAIVMRKRMDEAAREEAEKTSKENKQKMKKGKWAQKSPNKSDAKESVFSDSPSPSNIRKVTDEEFKKPVPFKPRATKDISPPPGYNKRKLSESATQDDQNKKVKVEPIHGEYVEHDSSKDFRSVFLSNLDYYTKEDEILPIFKDCGPIEQIRLARDYKGRSKGFGYLIFEGSSSLPKALQLDRAPIGTRPLFVSPCDPSSRGKIFKYSSGLEKDKLFIKGLPKTMKESDIKSVFEEHAPIKSIRLVTHRNGYSKGICYIQFKDEQTAENVRGKMDGTFLEGFKINVMISNPSVAKVQPETGGFRPSPISLGQSRSSRGRQKLTFVPRSIQKRANDQNNEAIASTSLNGRSNNAQNGGHENSAPKSNEDFRKMLLK